MTTSGPSQVSDASLSLLQRLVDDAMDPGYQEAAERQVSRPVGWRSSIAIAVVLCLLGLLVVAAVLQVRRGAPAATDTRTALLQRVDTATNTLNDVEGRVDQLATRVADARQSALSGSTSDQALADEVNSLEQQVGGTAVSGPGVQVSLTDGPPAPAGDGGPDLARVLDTDIQMVVNGLFASGAQAVAVNGQRVTVLSPIRSAGEAILVGFRPLTPPYVVSAVGPPGLEDAFGASEARQELAGLAAAYGMGIDVSANDEVTVPARSDLQVRYARETAPKSIGLNEEGSP
jgi:uncharacterized protein YlxW (UPF0749 family)